LEREKDYNDNIGRSETCEVDMSKKKKEKKEKGQKSRGKNKYSQFSKIEKGVLP
jgi:hypothetical protein